MVSLQEWEMPSVRAWNLGHDIILELQAMADIDTEKLPELEPYFDPIAFQASNPDPKIE